MASSVGLEEPMRTFRLNDAAAEMPLCNPRGNFAGLHRRLEDDIPRFLFRVVSPHSAGKADETWVRSVSATLSEDQDQLQVHRDVFSKPGETKVARMLNQHLRWWKKDDPDEFVSWTSSLVFAIHYIFYRHVHRSDKSDLEDIKLYVVDTTLFPRGTFTRDLDLIDAFRRFDDHPQNKNLTELWDLRMRNRYWFGEYLTQGALKISGKCQMITGQMIVDGGRLYTLQPGFETTPKGEMLPWTVDYRDDMLRLQSAPPISLKTMKEKIRVLQEITDFFDPGWKFPMAAYFAALIGQLPGIEDHESDEDQVFFNFFRSKELLSDERILYAPSRVLDRVREVFRVLDKDARLRESFDDVRNAELALHRVKLRALAANEHGFRLTVDSNRTLNGAGENMLRKVWKIKKLCDLILTDSPEEPEEPEDWDIMTEKRNHDISTSSKFPLEEFGYCFPAGS